MKVSVLLPLYNSERYIGVAIDSVLGQTFQDFELLVIDDGSTDSSAQIVSKYRDDRIKLHCRVHSGLIDGLNYGLSQVKGEFVARFDNDDICLPDRLMKQVSFLESHPDVDLVAGGAYLIDANGRDKNKIISMPESHDDIVRSLKNFFNPIIHPTVMFRKEKIISIGGYRQAFQAGEDYDLWLRMSRNRLKMKNLPYPIIKLRKHRNNMSVKQLKSSVQSCLFALFEYLYWDKRGIEFTSLPSETYELTRKEVYESLISLGLIELLCWRQDFVEKVKTVDVKAVISFSQYLSDRNKREIFSKSGAKVFSEVSSIVDDILLL